MILLEKEKNPSHEELESVLGQLKLACAQFEDTSMQLTRFWTIAKDDAERTESLRFLASTLDDDIRCVRNAQREAYRLLGKPEDAEDPNSYFDD